MRKGDLVGIQNDKNSIETAIITDVRGGGKRLRVFVIPRMVYEAVDKSRIVPVPRVPSIIPKSITAELLTRYINRRNPQRWIRRYLGREKLVIREVENPNWLRRRTVKRPRLRLRRSRS